MRTPKDLPIAVRHAVTTNVYDNGIDSKTPDGYDDPRPFEYMTLCGRRWTRELPRPVPTDAPRTCKTCAEKAAPGTEFQIIGHTATELENLPTTDQK